MADNEAEFVDFGAEIPDELKGLRACLRCSLLKTFRQFDESGCENCEFLGQVAVMETQSSWVAKWQRIASFVPGIYALEVTGKLPDDMIELCENYGYEIRSESGNK